ncbi:PSD1 and planctomycete cytochrome C domain-containing protein [Fuerstiella marisgermanici]|nr:PSD1 and planctomycete cytochrome C domain-containing protein [Fuerstiella marisgermanici]
MLAIVFRILTVIALANFFRCASADELTAAQHTFVQTKVLPLLEARCFECHKAGKEPKGGLVLSGRKAMLAGGESGPAIVPGKPDESLLMEAIRYESFEMPPRSRMPKEEVAILEKWIADGAPWPAELDTDPVATAREQFPLQERRDSHWAWQPIRNPSPPPVQTSGWTKDSLDAFILAKLEAEGLTPAADADRYTLIRRLYFDLIGLPPTIEQVQTFVNNPADDDTALAAVVDELLQSRHFGERWGRHWLDLVRYAETLGHEFDYPLHNAWRYRDYVIRAFNEDVPYDQFVREHIAGDLLPEPRLHQTELYNESVIATGFWFLGEDKHAPVDVRAEEAAKIDNQIDVFSKTFLGMTVACARCHDHKFDAISTVDYYALAGFLQSSRRQTAWLDPGKKIEAAVNELSKLRRDAIDIVHNDIAGALSTDQFSTLAQTAIQVAQSPQKDGEDASPADALAESNNCDKHQLNNWVAALQLKSQAGIEQPLSLPAFLAQAKGNANGAVKVRKWSKKVLSKAPVSDTTLFQDLRDGLPEGWFALGPAFKGDPSHKHSGLSWQKDGAYFQRNGGVSSSTLSPELRGTLASPTFELTHPEILVRVAGEGTRLRLVIDGYVMNEFSELLFKGAKQAIDTDGEYRWIRLAGDVHRHQGHRAHLEFLDEGDGWFAVQEIRFVNTPGAAPPRETPLPMNQMLAKHLASLEKVDVKTAINEWTKLLNDDRMLLAETAVNHRLLPKEQYAALNESLAAWSKLASGLPKPIPALAMTDGTGEDEQVFIRGNPRNLGEVAPRMLLTALRDNDRSLNASGSGRLQLAEDLLAEDNPLPARVAVNRIWHHLLGRGIVETTDNFGVLGKTPSHPELLDHLATRFRNEGWSVKKMIRSIALSRTYRLSTGASAAARDKDPTNQLWHSAAIKRLQGEAVRDAILAVTGGLDETIYGPSVPVHLTKFMQGRGRPKTDGPVDGNGRRSIYILVNRNFLSPFMQAFDVPAPVTTIGKRTVSNVPAQALIMLNNEFVNQQAELWAKQLLKNEPSSAEAAISTAWFQLLSRPPKADELRPLMEYYQAAGTEGDSIAIGPMTEICHVLLNTKEFMFLR